MGSQKHEKPHWLPIWSRWLEEQGRNRRSCTLYYPSLAIDFTGIHCVATDMWVRMNHKFNKSASSSEWGVHHVSFLWIPTEMVHPHSHKSFHVHKDHGAVVCRTIVRHSSVRILRLLRPCSSNHRLQIGSQCGFSCFWDPIRFGLSPYFKDWCFLGQQDPKNEIIYHVTSLSPSSSSSSSTSYQLPLLAIYY